MIYEFMRLILFFDLPMTTKKEIKTYTHFRKYLIKNGYMMMQFSVYCKIFPNREVAVKHADVLRKNIPKEGQIRLLMVTEKQYARIEVIVGGVSNQEKIVNADSFIKL
ncbi:CRISPR-associated endonuclease Cas2 [Coprobacillus sp. AF33-1AC]|nr:CRISPR-associated endonuclease Cas2 [Coprobacillus sp. AF33-1AC]